MNEYLENALVYATKGWPVFPCGEDKRPLTSQGFKDASADPEQIKTWWERWPRALIGVPMGARSGLFCVDLDRKPGEPDGVATWTQLTTIHETPPTLSAVSPSTGEHRYFQFQDGLRSIPLNKLAPGIEIKAEGGYMIMAPSKRNVGSYKWTNGADVAPPPQWLLDRIKAHYVKPTRSTPTEAVAPQRISEALAYINPDIGRAEWFAIGCALYSELKENGFEVWDTWSSRGDKYVADEMERQWASIVQANGYAYSIGTLFYYAQNAGWTNGETASFEEENRPGTPEDGGQHARQDWPEMRDEAYYGFAGELVKTISPHSEADPVALLVQTLVCAGNVIGRDCYFQVENDRHHTNLFAALVGESSKARKGVSFGRVRAVVQEAAFEWARDRIQTGLSSGEGLIHAVRDPSAKVDKDGKPVDEGVSDKRLLVVESEFAGLLSVMERPGNTISSLIRLAWDGGRLSTLTRNNPITATDALISILAHITKDELKARLTRTDMANGFANRYLYLLIRRARELPFGGDLTDSQIRELGAELKNKIDLGMNFGEAPRKIVWSEAARPEWAQAYHELSKPRPGLAGAITQRGEAQVVRLALIYALLDKSYQIEPVHLRAARAVWDYSEASVHYLFGSSLGDDVADTILTALRAAGAAGMNRTNIYDLYGGRQNRDRISAALALLFEHRRATRRQEYSRGRPVEIWVAI